MGWTTSRRWQRRINIISDFLVGFLMGRRGGVCLILVQRRSHTEHPATLLEALRIHSTYVGIVRISESTLCVLKPASIKNTKLCTDI